jgi:hypothetical protein
VARRMAAARASGVMGSSARNSSASSSSTFQKGGEGNPHTPGCEAGENRVCGSGGVCRIRLYVCVVLLTP